METQQSSGSAPNKRLIGILVAVPALLLIPFTAMKFTNEVNWSLSDFIIMGILLLSVGLTFEFIMRKFKTTKQRLLLAIVLFIVFFLIWAELAVGIFGSPFAGS